MDKRSPGFVDQSIYYPFPAEYYGVYCTGYQSPSEWDDHQRFFGLGGSDPHYSGMRAEDYVYYTPSYEFAHSPYNPYNPFVPGAILGVDGTYIGDQQYYAGSAYEHTTTSPAYYPFALQPRSESIPTTVQEPRLLNAGALNTLKPTGLGFKHTPAATVGTKSSTEPSSGTARLDFAHSAYNQIHSFPKILDATSKQTVGHTNVTSRSSGATHSTSSVVSQGKVVPGSTYSLNQVSHERSPSLRTPFKVSLPVANGSSNFQVVGVGPRSQYGEISNSGKSSADFLREQNRGPRTNRDKSQWTSTISVKAYREAACHSTEDTITIYADQYNKEDFPVNYTDAKFFVIKSYSEDDVHKSIKYNVWSSTTNGNKRLDSAYEDAQRIASGKLGGCPIFLFFSVNASGLFCGVAEMVGPVDFHKDMGFWQHDKWNGSFPVKWHIIKDVPNNNFRHIILENNENRPVTNSRDTQEIRYKPGLEMLTIFKNYTMKASLLDDFIYYEDRQKIMMEEKARYLSRNYRSSFYVPTVAPPEKSNSLADHSLDTNKDPINPNDLNNPITETSANKQVLAKPEENLSSSELHNVKQNVAEDAEDVSSVLKIDSLNIDPKQAGETNADDVVSACPVPIDANGFTDESSGTFRVGTIPIHLEGLNLDKSGRPTTGRSLL